MRAADQVVVSVSGNFNNVGFVQISMYVLKTRMFLCATFWTFLQETSDKFI